MCGRQERSTLGKLCMHTQITFYYLVFHIRAQDCTLSRVKAPTHTYSTIYTCGVPTNIYYMHANTTYTHTEHAYDNLTYRYRFKISHNSFKCLQFHPIAYTHTHKHAPQEILRERCVVKGGVEMTLVHERRSIIWWICGFASLCKWIF